MSDHPNPIVLELAPLPRDQVGPFLLLGIDKSASQAEVEEAWAKRVIGARKGHHRVALEDVNWAREVVNDADRRIKADLTSLNPDTAGGVLRILAERFSLDGPSWMAADREKPLADYTPAVEVPSLEEVRAAVTLPELPIELPAVAEILQRFVPTALDPWDPNQIPEPPEESP